MVIADEGSHTPTLPGDAGPHERMLFKIYGFQTFMVSDTATDWGKTADGVKALSAEVRSVITKLQGADPPWEGPAATAAYSTLYDLSKALDERAGEIGNIKKGLADAAAAASAAMTSYSTRVRSVSTTVDRTLYQPSGGGNFNITGYEHAISSAQAERESAAQQVLSTFNADMGAAAQQMPVEAPKDSVMIDPSSGGGGDGSSNGPSSGGPGTTNYSAPGGNGNHVLVLHGEPQPPTDPPRQPPVVDPPPPWEPPVDIGDPGPPIPDPDPWGPQLDGPTTGTTSPGGTGSTGWAGTSPGDGSSSAPGVGTGAMTSGGMLTGGAAMLGRALGRGGPGGAGRPGPLVAGSTGSAGKGSSAAGGARGGAGGSARGGMAAGSQGGGRGGRGSGGIRGARSGGRYGVPKLGESGRGGRGVTAAGGGAGGRGQGKDKGEAPDVESLTHEDEETWFEGEGDSTPPVWR